MSPEDISDNFGESHHCINLKFENWWVPTENRTLIIFVPHTGRRVHVHIYVYMLP